MKRWKNGVRRLALPSPAVVLAGLLLGGCGPGVTDPHATRRFLVPAIVRQMPVATLLAAPDSLAVEGRSIDLEAHVWWNMAPALGPPRRNGLIALIRMTEPDLAVFPAGIEAKYLWVVRGDHVWRAVLILEETHHDPPNEVVRVARHGPSYDGILSATVIVGVVVPDGSLRLVRIPGVIIQTPM